MNKIGSFKELFVYQKAYKPACTTNIINTIEKIKQTCYFLLNIIGISGDNRLSDWVEAIDKDSIPWLNISDLGGFYNRGFMLYGVKFIPRLILLDKDGIIIDDNFGYSFFNEDALKKIFKN